MTVCCDINDGHWSRILGTFVPSGGRPEHVGDPALLFWAATLRHTATSCAGDIDESDRCLAIAGKLAEQLDEPTLNWRHTIQRASRALLAGDTDGAEQLATEALQIGTDSGQPDATTIFGVQLMTVSWERGTLGELVPLIEKAIADNPGLPTLNATLAVAHAEGDRFDEAGQLLEQVAAADFDLRMDLLWLVGIARYAETAIACRDPKYVRPLLDRLAPWADQIATIAVITIGPVSHVLGGLTTVLGRYEEADAYFAQASAFSERAGAKFFGARTGLSWGMMLAERGAPGDAEKARELLTKAQTAAAANGYANVERRATTALQQLDA